MYTTIPPDIFKIDAHRATTHFSRPHPNKSLHTEQRRMVCGGERNGSEERGDKEINE